MSISPPARTAARRSRSAVLAALVVGAGTLCGVLGFQSLGSSSRSTSSPSAASPSAASSFVAQPLDTVPGARPGAPPGGARPLPRPQLGADGSVPDGVTVFNDRVPAVANLDPALLAALRRAATDAADGGVHFVVNSGWRTPEYQERLLRDAVAEYGSAKEAARWVATPETSPHVSGEAVDLGPAAGAAWLSKHGAAYGLCRIYANEPWHFELRPDAIDHGCPHVYADPTHDPRMQ